jgi:hypothetical protein
MLARFGGRHRLASTRFLIAFAEGAYLIVRQRNAIYRLHRRPRESYGYSGRNKDFAKRRFPKP